jgi:YD repeat-containing protein
MALPNLDSLRTRSEPAPRTPPHIPSTMRSRRKPLESRRSRRVGDALPVQSASVMGGEDYHTFDYVRFLISPSYGQLQSLADSPLIFGLDGLTDVSPSFDLYAVPVPQAGAAKIAFASNRDGNVQIYLMNADGSGQIRLTNNGANDDAPRWSPNGSKILFQSDRDDPVNGYNDVYAMNADGTGQARLTASANDDCGPSWSPDGSKIVFQSLRDGQHYQVYSMNADGTNQVNLGNSAGNDRQPSWSSNGTKIAFASDRDHTGFSSVYVMNSNGTGQQRLTFSADDVSDEHPAWSRDGSKIAFVSTRVGDKEIYVMNADGTGQTRLTNAEGNDDSPFWSPDGSKIIFRSDRLRDCCDSTSQVWVINSDGSGLANLSGNQFGDYASSWTSGSSNQPPVANAGGSYSGITGQNTAFSGTSSFDPDGSITSYSWSFGDGGTASGSSPTHAYASSGAYTVTLTVTDNLGAQGVATTTANVSSSSSDGFVSNFLQQGLARQPRGDEGAYWSDILRAAYPKGHDTMLLAMREFGMTVFESAEYASRNRTDHWYVYDLYKTYLMRDPDASGWAFWEAQLPSMGREQLRHAFDESIEFGNIVSTLNASGSPSPAVSSLATARVDPFNQTGDQLRARDCEWGVTLLSLPGRAGLELGLGLSYSSLVWTRSGPYAYFDEDGGSPSPGFRLGFATIQGPYFDAQAAKTVYVLTTSAGSRIELRQVGTTSTYEAGDSSYLQLIAGGTLLLRSTDGTQVSYSNSANGWRATAIEDRNGNFISVNYDWRGDITSITDTLGRVITFNYDANANLSTITQTWQVNGAAQTHTWASFGWGIQALQPSASDLSAVGTYAGEVIPVLTQVGLDDGSRYNFEYTSAGQVNVIRRYTSDSVERSRTTYDYATLADDCPRVVNVRVSADNWTGVNGVPAEVDTQFADPGDGSHTMTAPDGTVYKDFYGAGWQRGLVTQSEVWSDEEQQKLVTTHWAQDDQTAVYQTNPRVTETNVFDFPKDAPSNRRRTTIDYGIYAAFGLPYRVTEYAADGVQELRRSYTDYNLSQAYTDRRIIGLVSMTHVYDSVAGRWLAKMTYAYDEAGSIQPQATTATGHDQAYDSSFLSRGNVTSVTRWDADDTVNASKAVTSRMVYNAAGSVLTTTDPQGHQISVAYVDSFSDGNNSRNTFAYPTTLTDGDGYSSSVQFNFDFGSKTREQGPPPAGQTSGLVQTFSYDGAARIQQTTTVNNGAYVRYVYGPNYVQQFSTVNNVADEGYSVSMFDGAGRVVASASNHPGSNGGYRAQATQYDLTGRAVAQSNPAEIDGNWSPVGEDAAGWFYTRRTYDWKGRPRITTNTDGARTSASYDGCGCAGGEVVTLTDEVGRQQKVYSDALGRQRKTETLNWDGSVYSTSANTLDALDRVTFSRQYQGADQSAVYQETAITYDGHGRLSTHKAPAESAATVYEYNADDTLHKVTDARGVYATYSYNNNRRLPTGIAYTVPSGVSPSVEAVAPVVFQYDAAGNRTLMTDGLGQVEYHYDSMSRMSWEQRTLTPLNGATYTIDYDYNLAGEMKGITDPFGAQVGYTYDQAGQVTDVTGQNFAGVQSYAAGITYRAWGAVKGIAYGDSRSLSITYDARLRVKRYDVPSLMTKEYNYFDDGRVSYTQDLTTANSKFDRAYSYDHMGRVTQALSGQEARGGAPTTDRPYNFSYAYDAWGDLTERPGSRLWSRGVFFDEFPQHYTNGRNDAWQYDAAGNLVNDGDVQYTYDAAGKAVNVNSEGEARAISYDGDGQRVKSFETLTHYDDLGNAFTTTATTYELHSTVMGGRVLIKLDAQGQRQRGYVYLGGDVLAWQRQSGGTQSVAWEHRDASNSSLRVTTQGGTALSAESAELDPSGMDAGVKAPPQLPPNVQRRQREDMTYPGFADATGSGATECRIDGVIAPCSTAMQAVNSGAAGIDTSRDDSSMLNIPGFVFVPDYGDASQDHYDPSHVNKDGTLGAVIGVVTGQFVAVGAGTNLTTSIMPLGSATRPSLNERLQRALNQCLSELELYKGYGFTVVSFNPSAKGKSGSITVDVGYARYDGDNRAIKILNDATSLRSSDIPSRREQDHTYDPGGPRRYPRDTVSYGYTPWNESNGFTASDADRLPKRTRLAEIAGNFIETQFHEFAHGLGNAIDPNSKGTKFSDPHKLGDAGDQLVECVGNKLK